MKAYQWLRLNKTVFSDSDLRFLIKQVCKRDSLEEFMLKDDCLTAQTQTTLDTITKHYREGVPLAYLLGKEEFYGRAFHVDSRVLIPRQETERLVEKAVSIIENENIHSVLDLCCGSANIAISIQKTIRKNIHIIASDLSPQALAVARQNQCLHRADIALVNADLFGGFAYGAFDVIVSNPPYVETENIQGFLRYEPSLALEAGQDGLVYVEKIITTAHQYLRAEGYLLMEVGHRQRNAVDRLVAGMPYYETLEWIKDYSGHDRGIVLKRR